MKKIIAKFGNMRKAVPFTVCPRPTNVNPTYDTVTLQSGHREVQFSSRTGKGHLSPHAANYPRVGLSGTVEIELDSNLIAEIMAAMPQPGEVIHGVLRIA